MIHCLSPGIAVQTKALRRICFCDWENAEFNGYFLLHVEDPVLVEHREKTEKKDSVWVLEWSTVLLG